MKNAPQLITYVDRLAGDLTGLRRLLDGPLEGVFGGVHLLPFFDPIDGADAGFDPIDHTQVDSRLGDWSQVGAIGQDHDLTVDLIVNHVSDRSPQFLDFVENGDSSASAGMFLSLNSVFPDGATEAELTSIYRPRPGLPFTMITVAGRPRLIWTTFSGHQVDIDVSDPAVWSYLMGILDSFASAAVSLVRLDAVGYAVKKKATSCFMIPETFEFIARLGDECRSRGMEVLVEIHSSHRAQTEIAAKVEYVYDFALPPLVLDAIFNRDSGPLKGWLQSRPSNCVTVLDTHDGIGVIDVGPDVDTGAAGLLSDERIDALVDRIHAESVGQSMAATGTAASNLDLYQVNCTFLDALGGDTDRYRLARLIQMVVPGVPQIYYVGLLHGRNDMELLGQTGVGRDINRHRYAEDELDEALASPDVQELLGLCRWRGSDPAFNGTFTLLDSDETALQVQWENEDRSLLVDIDLATLGFVITITDPDGSATAHSDLSFCQ